MSSSMTGFTGMGSQGMRGGTGGGNNMGQRLAGDRIPKGFTSGSLQNFTTEQMQLFQQLFGQVDPEGRLSRLAGGDQSEFDQLEAPALRQFAGLQGNIASRFSQTGSRRSSGFQNTINAASSNFAEQLQSNRQQLQRQALQDLMGISESLLGQRPTENFLVQKPQKQRGFTQQLLGGAAGGIGSALGSAGQALFAGGA
jgi:hypothetical protein